MFYGLARRNDTAALEVDLTGAAIRVNFSVAVPALQPGAAALCMAVGLNGSVTVTDVEDGTNTCHASDQGHFTLVVGGAGDGHGGNGADGREADIGEVVARFCAGSLRRYDEDGRREYRARRRWAAMATHAKSA